MNRNYILLIIIFAFALSCKSNKTQVSDQETLCSISAEVKDYSGLDGCGKILITSDGYKILPVNSEILNPFAANTEVMIAYVKKEDMASTCMAENFMAEITCINSLDIKPMAKECVNAQNKSQVKWLKQSQLDQVTKIDKFSFLGDGWSYIIYSTSGIKSVFNCQGDLLCNYKLEPDTHCQTMISEMTFLNTIYTAAQTK